MGNVSYRSVGVIGPHLGARLRLVAALAAAIACLSATATAMAADARAGRDLAQRWCSGCHVVDPSGRGPDTAPPFPTIAQRNPGNRDWMRAWLTAPHPPMPNLNLNRRQIDDIAAYLESLAPR